MDFKEINLQYQGYINTPKLWLETTIYTLQQIEWQPVKTLSFKETLPKGIRLGKRVEQFVFHELKQLPHISLITQNLQIQKDKQTLGEIDGLLLLDGTPIHLEIIYKFYVCDDTVGTTELDHWIGPNRRDSLVEKLMKLKNKQLPLLYHPETLKYLDKYRLEIDKITQYVLFKAQLFVPYKTKNLEFGDINSRCVVGFYVKKNELLEFNHCKFYIPSKANWLVVPHVQVRWLSFDAFLEKVHALLEQQKASLVWIKHPNGELTKCFVVWW